MPALIPANIFNIPRPNIHPHPRPSPEYLQSPPQQPPCKLSSSDDKLHKDLDDQIQLVKQIQQILGTEQMKLKIMMKELNLRKRKRIVDSTLAKASEKRKSLAKRQRIFSSSSINSPSSRNLVFVVTFPCTVCNFTSNSLRGLETHIGMKHKNMQSEIMYNMSVGVTP